ncbi:MAG TPA: GyrI-like domain-containing protein [Gemmatimonadaceae bacterium]
MSSYSVQLRDLPSVPVAVVRRRATRAELSKLVPECCGLVWSALRAQGIKGGRHVAIYWNGDIRLEVGAEVAEPFVEQESLIRSGTPAGLAAFVTHFGPYHQLGAAHDAIRAWCKSNGHGLVGPNWEIYGHWQDEWNTNPSLIRTDVFYQISK